MPILKTETEKLPVSLRSESLKRDVLHSSLTHMHDSIETIIVEKGSVVCRTDDKPFTLYKGDVCFINRRQLHSILSSDEGEGEYIAMMADPEILENELVQNKYIRPMLSDIKCSHLRFSGDSSPAALISESVLSVKNAMDGEEPGYELDILAEILRIFRTVYKAYSVSEYGTAPAHNFSTVQKMVEYIYSGFGEEISLDDIASAGLVSRSQCTKLFRQHIRMSPIEFLNKYRLEQSLILLRQTGMPVSSVAAECGFAVQSYYNRLFLKNYGCTPTEYRKGN